MPGQECVSLKWCWGARQTLSCASSFGPCRGPKQERALQPVEGDAGRRAQHGGGAAHERIVDGAALDVLHRGVQRVERRGARCGRAQAPVLSACCN